MTTIDQIKSLVDKILIRFFINQFGQDLKLIELMNGPKLKQLDKL